MPFKCETEVDLIVNGIRAIELTRTTGQNAKSLNVIPDNGTSKTSQLTTRTSADEGILTLASGHGFQVGDIVGLTWLNVSNVRQHKLNMEVTAAGATTITVEAIDVISSLDKDLPALNTTGITVSKRNRIDLNLGAVLMGDWIAAQFKITGGLAAVAISEDTLGLLLFDIDEDTPVFSNDGLLRNKYPPSVAFEPLSDDGFVTAVDLYSIDPSNPFTRFQLEILHN